MVELKGNLFGNTIKDAKEIGAGVTTLVGGILGTDKQARQALADTFAMAAQNPGEFLEMTADTILSTYNLTLDDIGTMPLGEVVGNVVEGIWENPLDAALDIVPGVAAYKKLAKGAKATETISKGSEAAKIIDKADTYSVRIKAAENALQNNIRYADKASSFNKEIDAIAKTYDTDTIAKSMQAIETIGFKNAPKELRACMNDLSKANDSYKQFVEMSGANLIDDVEFAAAELLAKEHKVPFEDIINNKKFKNTNMFKETKDYVVENDVRPLFHLKPKINSDVIDNADADILKSNIFKRTYGTMDYAEAAKDLTKKADEFTYAATRAKVANSASDVNDYIKQYNKANGTNIQTLDVSERLFKNEVWHEINSELKKTMLSSGVYLGANIITTTLTILNNFDLNAAIKTFKNMPKFRKVVLQEAKTPGLKFLSKINNAVYRPFATVDKFLEDIGIEYIKNVGVDKAKYMQSMIPTLVPSTNAVDATIKSILPFGSYPVAAMKEVGANLVDKPGKSLAYNQVNKFNQLWNEAIQRNYLDMKEVDTTKAIRKNDEGELVQRNIVVTPIQAANMFMFGEYGDAIQIPLVKFLNKLLSGTGDPNVFEVNGRQYRVKNGKVTTENGTLELLPALAFIGRESIGAVRFYNDVIVPLTTDKYIKDEGALLNKAVSDAQYANLSKAAQRKVVDNAREKLGKRLVGTYEYDYYKPYITKSTRKKLQKQRRIRDELRNL